VSCRSQWPFGLRCSNTGIAVSNTAEGVLIVVCCVSADLCDSSSLVQRSPTGCVFVWDLGTSEKLSKPDLGCSAIQTKYRFFLLITNHKTWPVYYYLEKVPRPCYTIVTNTTKRCSLYLTTVKTYTIQPNITGSHPVVCSWSKWTDQLQMLTVT
jgi:hypothetical protein